MSPLASIRAAIDTVAGTALAWLVIGLFNVFFWVVFVIVTPFVMVRFFLQRRAPGIFGNPGGVEPEAVAAFDAVWQDLVQGDIARLEAHARDREDFPHGRDPFIGRHWLTNAVHAGSVASVRWMLDQGVVPDFEDDEGYSPLMSAVSPDNANAAELVSLLLDHGADPNFRVNLDQTALHVAACQATPEVVRLLLERGADPFAYDSDYVPARPIDDARSCKRPENVEVLRVWMESNPAGEAS